MIFRDISQRLQAKAALRESAEQLRHAFDEAVVGMALVDRQARFVKANRLYCQMLGYSESELLQMTVAQVTHPDDAGRDLDRIRQVLAGLSNGYSCEKHYLTRAGKTVVGKITVSIIRERGGEPLYAFGMFQDQTQTRDLEHQLRQSQKMEAVGRLAGGVAHDFNNLLTAILGYCDLLQQRAANPQDREDLQEIHKAGQRAAELTSQLLAFSRQNPIQHRVVNLNDVVQDIRRMLTRLIGDDVELITEMAPDLAPIRGDPTQLAQVIMNLAVNARDAMPQGGRLTLRTGNLELPARERPGGPAEQLVCLDVEDTGTGMNREVLAHMFEPFFTTKGPGRGSGLGLAVAYGIVKQAGGHFQVDSDPGCGARFRIFLPRAEAALVQAPVRSSGEIGVGRGETILLVEDEAQIRQLFCLLLQQRGYQVLAAANAEDALALVQARPQKVQLLITDVVLPHRSGPELAKQLQLLQPEIRIIFISGYAPGDLIRPDELPLQALFLQKPFSAELLARKVREALEQPLPSARA